MHAVKVYKGGTKTGEKNGEKSTDSADHDSGPAASFTIKTSNCMCASLLNSHLSIKDWKKNPV